VLASVGGIAWAVDTGGGDTSSTGGCTASSDQTYIDVEATSPDDPGYLGLTWASGTGDDVSPVLTVRALGRGGMSYLLEGRIHFGDTDYRWTQDIGTRDSMEQTDVVLDASALTWWSDAQSDWISDLSVKVVPIGPGGQRWPPQAAPPLRMVWVDGAARLMTGRAAATLAPHGAWSARAQAVVPVGAVDGKLLRFHGEDMDLSLAGG